MPAYIIFNYEITDRSRIEELSQRSKISDANSKYKSKLVAATCVESVEGKALPHIVMYEFENIEIATKWYYEDSSQDVAVLRKEITNGWVSIIPGYTV
ncbi:MAG: DUF1330 domain-containing protein [Bermanella sp.]